MFNNKLKWPRLFSVSFPYYYVISCLWSSVFVFYLFHSANSYHDVVDRCTFRLFLSYCFFWCVSLFFLFLSWQFFYGDIVPSVSWWFQFYDDLQLHDDFLVFFTLLNWCRFFWLESLRRHILFISCFES